MCSGWWPGGTILRRSARPPGRVQCPMLKPNAARTNPPTVTATGAAISAGVPLVTRATRVAQVMATARRATAARGGGAVVGAPVGCSKIERFPNAPPCSSVAAYALVDRFGNSFRNCSVRIVGFDVFSNDDGRMARKHTTQALTVEAAEPITISGGNPARIGYARVSTSGQAVDAQLDALTAAGCGRVYVDTISGSKAARPGLDAMRAHLRQGDTVVVTKLDRLGRSMVDLVNTLDAWCKANVNFVAVEQAIDTSTPAGRMVCSMLAAVAEFELSMNHERTSAALAARKARGITGGRPPKMTPAKLEEARRLIAGGASLAQAGKVIGVAASTLHSHLRAAQAVTG